MTPEIHILETGINTAAFHIYFTHEEKNMLQRVPTELKKYLEIKAKHTEFTGKKIELLHLDHVIAGKLSHVAMIGLGNERKNEERVIRDQMTKAVQLARKVKAKDVYVNVENETKYVQYIVEGALLGDYSMDTYKNADHKKKYPHIKVIHLIVKDDEETQGAVKRGVHVAQANIFTRDFVNMPGSHVYPETLAESARKIGKKSNGSVEVEVLNEEACRKLGMGSFLGVGQGSDKKSVFIVLHYKGSGTKKFALVGKSITFDSGGLSLKPGEFMMDMKTDMAGGAVVLGVFDYLASEHPTISEFSDIYGILPAAENMVSGSSLKPGDIVTAMNGKTIEVLNTDAEGRLVLADGLTYADTVLHADYIIDIATLTGACAVALGNDLAGLFTSNDDFEKKYGIAAKKAGDDYWRMPLHSAYLTQMKSTIADLKNIGGGRYGGAITAALFLSEFVKKAKWMHIDIAGPAHSDKGGASGWGVLSVIYFLETITKV
jgi:leucyl aminopeptidase